MTQDQKISSLPASLRGLDQATHLDSPALKQHYVTTMFEIIAPRYNRFTRAFSFGMDAVWKNQLVELAKPYVTEKSRVLDLACGTGDLAFAFARLAPQGHILGIDAAPTMISLAQSTATSNAVHHIDFSVGDLTLLTLPDASQDLVSMGYGLRNVPVVRTALLEVHRVLRPGGIFVNLDFTRPEEFWWRILYLRYLLIMGNLYGTLWHGDPAVYGYIARSIERFISSQQLTAELQSSGFEILETRTKLRGGVCLHLARKPL
jgi:demethylmenaquinone methyltransferase/2-methoxy-6-polyprenyl-1,4-benzoquinol methylase